jgi:hypothetical protein
MNPPPTVRNNWSPHATLSGNMIECYEQPAGSGICSARAEPAGTLRLLDGGHVAFPSTQRKMVRELSFGYHRYKPATSS